MTNKELIREFYREVFVGGNAEAARKYLHPDYRQHNPGVPQGADGFVSTFTKAFEGGKSFPLLIDQLVEDGDMMYVLLRFRNPDNSWDLAKSVWDIYRIKDGRLIEHWDVFGK